LSRLAHKCFQTKCQPPFFKSKCQPLCSLLS
jgi:hypothetical protein